MKNILIFCCVGVAVYLVYNQFFRYEFYEGTWVSNEEMTLASMASVKRIPQKARNAMSRNFFGKMVIHVEDGEMEYYFTDFPDDVTRQPVSIEVKTPTRVLSTSFDVLTRKDVTRELRFENGCYSVEVPKWRFKEFFCRKSLL